MVKYILIGLLTLAAIAQHIYIFQLLDDKWVLEDELKTIEEKCLVK